MPQLVSEQLQLADGLEDIHGGKKQTVTGYFLPRFALYSIQCAAVGQCFFLLRRWWFGRDIYMSRGGSLVEAKSGPFLVCSVCCNEISVRPSVLLASQS